MIHLFGLKATMKCDHAGCEAFYGLEAILKGDGTIAAAPPKMGDGTPDNPGWKIYPVADANGVLTGMQVSFCPEHTPEDAKLVKKKLIEQPLPGVGEALKRGNLQLGPAGIRRVNGAK